MTPEKKRKWKVEVRVSVKKKVKKDEELNSVTAEMTSNADGTMTTTTSSGSQAVSPIPSTETGLAVWDHDAVELETEAYIKELYSILGEPEPGENEAEEAAAADRIAFLNGIPIYAAHLHYKTTGQALSDRYRLALAAYLADPTGETKVEMDMSSDEEDEDDEAEERVEAEESEARADPYEVPGIPRTADWDAVKKAYRDLARQTHSDRFPDLSAEDIVEYNAKFVAVTDAKECLRKLLGQ